jgi:hypothetical protein
MLPFRREAGGGQQRTGAKRQKGAYLPHGASQHEGLQHLGKVSQDIQRAMEKTSNLNQ